MMSQKIRPEVTEVIEETLRREMEPFGFVAVKVEAAPDHDGDPSLMVDVDYKLSERPVDPKVVAGLVTKLRSRLSELEEARFPYIRHHFSDQQKVVGFP